LHGISVKTNSLNTNLLLGAAFAGLSLSQASAATVYNESSDGDLSGPFGSPTDLTSTFGNFLSDSGVIGSISTGTRGSDLANYFYVQMTPNVAASIPYSFSGDSDDGGMIFEYVTVYAHTSGAFLVDGSSSGYMSGSSVSDTLNFITPSDGLVRFAVSQETSNATMNYTIGTVPETGTAVLSLVGLAAAVLRRRRQQG